MGLPTRLHGDAVADFFGAIKGFCPKCLSFREWKVVYQKRKLFKECQKCGKRKAIEEPELSKLVAQAKAKRARKKAKKKVAKK